MDKYQMADWWWTGAAGAVDDSQQQKQVEKELRGGGGGGQWPRHYQTCSEIHLFCSLNNSNTTIWDERWDGECSQSLPVPPIRRSSVRTVVIIKLVATFFLSSFHPCIVAEWQRQQTLNLFFFAPFISNRLRPLDISSMHDHQSLLPYYFIRDRTGWDISGRSPLAHSMDNVDNNSKEIGEGE